MNLVRALVEHKRCMMFHSGRLDNDTAYTKALEAAGLIRREGDPVDGRVTHLYLTPAGEEMDAACARGRDFLIETLYQGLTEEETAALYTALDKMIRNLQAAAATLPEPPQGKDE